MTINSKLSPAEYVKTVIKQDQIDKYLNNGKDFIDDAAIFNGTGETKKSRQY